jgi:enamine deaminase RidA (YjgF/YER057c/UK114 family)
LQWIAPRASTGAFKPASRSHSLNLPERLRASGRLQSVNPLPIFYVIKHHKKPRFANRRPWTECIHIPRQEVLRMTQQQSKPTHTRIRMFNTKETYPNQNLDNDLCQAVRAGNTVYVRGQIGTDFEGNLVGLGDPRAQAEQAMKNVKQLLEEAGSDLSHIVKTTTYLIDPRYREPVYQEVGKWLKGVFPISTGLVISGLGQPEWLMEIDVIAVIPE